MIDPLPPRAARRPTRGFSLIELLVVLGIIVLIAGITLPMLVHAYKSASATRARSDLSLLETALTAYKGDFGDYPRFDDDNSTDSLNVQQDRGARLLCRALLAPGPATVSGAGTPTFLGPNVSGGKGQAPDGADGPGFRLRAGNGGRIYPPYVQTDKVKLGNSGAPGGVYDNVYFTDATFLDAYGHPILYYPALPGSTNTGPNGAFVCTKVKGTPQGNGTTPLVRPLYNGYDNYGYGETGTPVFLLDTEMQYVMGDRDNNGYLATSPTLRTATTSQPYLLWTAGPDGMYGRDPAGKSDDICNFDLPADLRK